MDACLKAFLDLVAWSEGTSTNPLTQNDGYDVIVTGLAGHTNPRINQPEIGREIFSNYLDHPFAAGRTPKLIGLTPIQLFSDASGRYQIMLKWWRPYKAMLKLTDFSPASQDAYALRQMKEHGVTLTSLTANPIEHSISACSNIWASFPGNDYKQHSHSMEALVQRHGELLRV
jgi:muramidase (phage lysozyme)